MLWLIYAESATYTSYGQHFVVEAEDSWQAEALAESAIEEYFVEEDHDDIVADGLEVDTYGTIINICEFDETHEQWEFYKDPSQSGFYIQVKD